MNKHFLTPSSLSKFVYALLALIICSTGVFGKSVFLDGLGDAPNFCQNSSLGLKKAVGSNILSLEGFFTAENNLDFAPVLTDCCNGSKAKSLTLVYNGKSCGQSSTSQASGKWSCADSNGGPNNRASVYIKVSEKSDGGGKIYFTGAVSLNGAFTPSATNAGATRFPSSTWFNIYTSQGGTLLQRVSIHTSCSTPIVIGDQFGSLNLQEVLFENGTTCNAAPPPPPPPPPTTGESCCNGSKPKSITVKFVASNCGASNTTQSSGKWSCADSNGGPSGAATVYVKASKDSNGGGGTFFAGTVSLDGTFTADAANAGLTKLPSNTWFNIYTSQGGALLQRVGIHTSCSAPLVLGEQFGSLVLTGVVFENGTTCDTPEPPNPPETCPTPVITINNTTPTNLGQICKGDQVVFTTADLGFPCLAYAWDFGANATPQTATGLGPHTVTYSAAGSATVSLTIDNHCDGGIGNTVCTAPPGGGGGSSCFKIDPPANGSRNGATYTLTNQNGEPMMLTVTGPGITSVEVKGGPGSVIYTTAPFTNLTAPINPSNGQPYGISHFTICTSGSSSSGGSNGGGDCCDSNSGKPKSLTMQYTGEGCSATSTSQSTSKYSCANIGSGPNGALSVYIKANDKEDGSGISYFAGNVAINGTFTATAPGSSLTTNTWFLIYSSQGGALLQKIKIHTSCSAPLIPGDQFGSLVLMSAGWANGAVCGQVTPPGPDCIDCEKTVEVTINVEDCTPRGKIGDFVWFDENCNGRQDDGEPGLPNVPVKLLTCSGSFLQITATDEFGKYCFNDLPPGGYVVMFTNPDPAVYTPTLSNQNGVSDDKDSDAGANGMTTCITLGPNENNPDIDAGFKPVPPPCRLNIHVSNIRCDGKNTPETTDDVYFFDITVTGTGTSSTWDGSWSNGFLGVAIFGPNAYNVPITLGPFPAGSFTSGNTFPPITVENGLNIDVSATDGANHSCSAQVTVLSPGPCSPGRKASLGDYVWEDLNKNGRQNANEPGVDGVKVQLYTCGGVFVGEQTTANGGKYLFTGLTPNTAYYVVFSDLPQGYVFTAMDQGNDGLDSDANPNTGQTACTFLSPGEVDLTIDAGLKFEPTPCDNVTDSGKIGFDESHCESYDPEAIVNLELPSGGSGQIHYIWLSSTTACPDAVSQKIEGATGPDYDPPTISVTTYYVRCARREGCTQWVESNCVVKEVRNVRSAGVIGNDEAHCDPYDPEEIYGLEEPQGGAGDYHYIWLSSTVGCPTALSDQIEGALGVAYDPEHIIQTTWYVRCVRRGDCQEWVESNCVVKEVSRCATGGELGGRQDNSLKQPNGNTPIGLATEIQLYPNPADGYATITWNTEGTGKKLEIKLFNQLGQTVKTARLENASEGAYTLGLDGLKDGQYALRLQIEGQAPVVKKLVVSH